MEREWRCKTCGTLIGIIKNNRITIRFKKLQYVVFLEKGSIMNVCRNCSNLNEMDSAAAA